MNWLLKFPKVLHTTLSLKRKYKEVDDYTEHIKDIYSISHLTDNSDKFASIRNRLSTLALQTGNESVLEIATGAGWQAFNLKQAGFKKVVAVDLVPERIEYCKKRLVKSDETLEKTKSQIIFEVMDATDLKFPDKSFDAIVISAALHDMPTAIKHKAFREFARVCKGNIVMFEPRTFRSPIVAGIYGSIAEFLDESMYVGEYVKDYLPDSLKSAGLTMTHQELAWHGLMEITVAKNISPY